MSHVAQPSIRPLPFRIRSRVVLWVGVALTAAAGIAVALVLIINSSDQSGKTAAVPVKQTATYPGRPDEGLGTLTSQSTGYTARPDEGLAPIRIVHSSGGYTARPDEGLAPISTQSAEKAQPFGGSARLGGPHRSDQHGQSFSGDRIGGPR